MTTEDTALILFRTENGVVGSTVISQLSAGRKNRLWVEIDGMHHSGVFDQELPEQLWIGADEGATVLVRDPNHGSSEQRRLATLPAGHAQGYAQCFESFVADSYAAVDARRDGGDAPIGLPTFADGARAAADLRRHAPLGRRQRLGRGQRLTAHSPADPRTGSPMATLTPAITGTDAYVHRLDAPGLEPGRGRRQGGVVDPPGPGRVAGTRGFRDRHRRVPPLRGRIGAAGTRSTRRLYLLSIDDPEEVAAAADDIRRWFADQPVPGDVVAGQVRQAYRDLGRGRVAVRSSATAEDLPGMSFAGQQDTFLNVGHIDALLDAVRACWASLWTARAISYRARQGVGTEGLALAVVVQRLINAEASGVMFTADPVTGVGPPDRDQLDLGARGVAGRRRRDAGPLRRGSAEPAGGEARHRRQD